MERELRLAARRGDYEQCELLISKSINIKAKDVNGMSALHFAVYNEHFDVAELLLERGASANQTDNFGQTALHGAIVLHSSALVTLLLDHGCLLGQMDIEGRTAMHKAVACGGGLEIAILLLLRGASIDTRDLFGKSPADLAVEIGGNTGQMAKLCRIWPIALKVWTLRQGQECLRVAHRTSLRRLPRDLVRVLFGYL
ncbi:hypothetical protein BASA81_003129 [Batrachochytrium salamandrivorans]|nr:hypothetical protein BASA81_003129 [Batrachochytrium salamandrivorans]